MIEIISGFILSDFINVIDEQSILMIYDDSVPVGSDKKAVYNKMKPYQVPGNIRRKKVKSIEAGQSVDFAIVVE